MRCRKGYIDELEELSRIYANINLIILLKRQQKKKMRLKALVYSQADYWYAITNRGKVFTCKNYSIKKDEDIVD